MGGRKKSTRVIAKNITMYPEQWAVLHQLAKDAGLGNVSGAARLVVSEWVQFKTTQLGIDQKASQSS